MPWLKSHHRHTLVCVATSGNGSSHCIREELGLRRLRSSCKHFAHTAIRSSRISSCGPMRTRITATATCPQSHLKRICNRLLFLCCPLSLIQRLQVVADPATYIAPQAAHGGAYLIGIAMIRFCFILAGNFSISLPFLADALSAMSPAYGCKLLRQMLPLVIFEDPLPEEQVFQPD